MRKRRAPKRSSAGMGLVAATMTAKRHAEIQRHVRKDDTLIVTRLDRPRSSIKRAWGLDALRNRVWTQQLDGQAKRSRSAPRQGPTENWQDDSVKAFVFVTVNGSLHATVNHNRVRRTAEGAQVNTTDLTISLIRFRMTRAALLAGFSTGEASLMAEQRLKNGGLLGLFRKVKAAAQPEGAIVVIAESFWRSIIAQVNASPKIA